jgi:hypothetical protein
MRYGQCRQDQHHAKRRLARRKVDLVVLPHGGGDPCADQSHAGHQRHCCLLASGPEGELLDVLTVTGMAAGLREPLAAGQTR